MPDPNTATLRLYQEMKRRIQQEFVLEDGEQTLEDTLDGLSDLKERIVAIMRESDRSKTYSEACDRLMGQLRGRQQRLDRRAERLKDLAKWLMQEAGLTTVKAPDMTISLSQSSKTKLVIDDEAVIIQKMPGLCKVERVPDRHAIRGYLEDGYPLEGARLETNSEPILVVRRT